MQRSSAFFSGVVAAALALACAGCGAAGTHVFRGGGIELRYPTGWPVSGFSRTVSPARLVVASYPVRRGEVEGDCGGMHALARLPRDGAAVLLIDYGARPNAENAFEPRPQHLRLDQLVHATDECFGDGYVLRFALRGHDLQAQVTLGADADPAMRGKALRIVNSIELR